MPQPSESSVVSNLSRPTKSSPLASEARLGLHDVRVDFSISKVPLPFLKEIIDGKNGSWVHPQRAHFWRSLGLLKKARRGPFLIVNAPFGAAESLQDLGFSLSLLSANTEANIFRQALRAFQAKPTDFLFVDDKVATEASFYEAMTAVPFGLMVFLLEQESSSVRCFSIPTHVPIESIAQYWPTVPRLISVVEASQQHLLTLQKQFQLGADAARISFGFRRPNLSFEVAFLPPDEREKALLSTLSSPDSLPAKVVFADEKQAHRISSILKKELPVALAKCCITDRPTYRIEEMSTRKPQSAALGAPASQAYIRTLVHLEYPIDKRAYAQDLQDVGFEPVDARSILFADDDDRDQIERRLQRKELPLSLLRSIFLAFPATSTAQCDLDFDGIHQDVLDDAIEILQEVGSIFRDKYSRCHRIFGKDEVADLELLLQQKAQERRDASEAMHAFVNVQSCRMLSWVSHFQDEHDHYQPCGMCDVCAPQNAKVRRQRAMTSMEHDLCFRFFSALNLPCLKDEAVQQGAHLGIPKGWVERFLNGLWRGEVLQGVGEIFRDPN
ncbi:MAG: hypothetical protein GY822_09110, partial [Deltaproteobacteria bacterium]|nr:hypothetical protein [Deltaproteobacteria bacterium]